MKRYAALHQLIKRLYFFMSSFALILILYACPYSSSYKLDNEAVVDIDRSLLGKWATMIDSRYGMQPVKMILREKNDKEYYIDIIGYLDDLKPSIQEDTLTCSAFTSIVSNWQFLNIEIKGQTYITEIIYLDNKLSVLPLAECFTAKYIKSGSELRTAVEFHFKTRLYPLYDESLCLRDMVRVN